MLFSIDLQLARRILATNYSCSVFCNSTLKAIIFSLMFLELYQMQDNHFSDLCQMDYTSLKLKLHTIKSFFKNILVFQYFCEDRA